MIICQWNVKSRDQNAEDAHPCCLHRIFESSWDVVLWIIRNFSSLLVFSSFLRFFRGCLPQFRIIGGMFLILLSFLPLSSFFTSTFCGFVPLARNQHSLSSLLLAPSFYPRFSFFALCSPSKIALVPMPLYLSSARYRVCTEGHPTDSSASAMIAVLCLLFVLCRAMPRLENPQSASLPSCGGCFSRVDGFNYSCCHEMDISNNECVCKGNVPCTPCAPSAKDKEKALSAFSAVPGSANAFFPSCGNCYSGINGVDFTCADCSISINRGRCTCGDRSPCIRCSPDLQNKQISPSVELPSCGPCYSAIDGLNYACCDEMTMFHNGSCMCKGGKPCGQCLPSVTSVTSKKKSPTQLGPAVRQNTRENGCATLQHCWTCNVQTVNVNTSSPYEGSLGAGDCLVFTSSSAEIEFEILLAKEQDCPACADFLVYALAMEQKYSCSSGSTFNIGCAFETPTASSIAVQCANAWFGCDYSFYFRNYNNHVGRKRGALVGCFMGGSGCQGSETS